MEPALAGKPRRSICQSQLVTFLKMMLNVEKPRASTLDANVWCFSKVERVSELNISVHSPLLLDIYSISDISRAAGVSRFQQE